MTTLPEVLAARSFASAHGSEPARFGSLAGVDAVPQIGASDEDIDEIQCGASTLVAGLMLLGEARTRAALRLLIARVTDPALLASLRRLSAARVLTVDDMHTLIRVAHEAMHSETVPCPLLVYRDLLWGCSSFTFDSRCYDICCVETEHGKHYVLGENDDDERSLRARPVLYDPWPADDGSASTLGETRRRLSQITGATATDLDVLGRRAAAAGGVSLRRGRAR
ncbi:MAG: hypothetical protein IT381_26705 [Deltaproteobacteria bacterium]|nr:hypothetical protein [Deltaproteobacteria bacterium]